MIRRFSVLVLIFLDLASKLVFCNTCVFSFYFHFVKRASILGNFKLCLSMITFYLCADMPPKDRFFTWDKISEMEYGNGRGYLLTNCTLTSPNSVFCDMVERDKGWIITDTLIFSKVPRNCNLI